MSKINRDFFEREPIEQRWLLQNTWCDVCNEADLGMSEPVEYEENNEIFVEGKCLLCGLRVVSVIRDDDAGE